MNQSEYEDACINVQILMDIGRAEDANRVSTSTLRKHEDLSDSELRMMFAPVRKVCLNSCSRLNELVKYSSKNNCLSAEQSEQTRTLIESIFRDTKEYMIQLKLGLDLLAARTSVTAVESNNYERERLDLHTKLSVMFPVFQGQAALTYKTNYEQKTLNLPKGDFYRCLMSHEYAVFCKDVLGNITMAEDVLKNIICDLKEASSTSCEEEKSVLAMQICYFEDLVNNNLENNEKSAEPKEFLSEDCDYFDGKYSDLFHRAYLEHIAGRDTNALTAAKYAVEVNKLLTDKEKILLQSIVTSVLVKRGKEVDKLQEFLDSDSFELTRKYKILTNQLQQRITDEGRSTFSIITDLIDRVLVPHAICPDEKLQYLKSKLEFCKNHKNVHPSYMRSSMTFVTAEYEVYKQAYDMTRNSMRPKDLGRISLALQFAFFLKKHKDELEYKYKQIVKIAIDEAEGDQEEASGQSEATNVLCEELKEQLEKWMSEGNSENEANSDLDEV